MFHHWRTFLLRQNYPKRLHSSSAVSQKQNPVLQKLLTDFTNVSYITDIVNKEEVKDVDYQEWRSRILLLKQHGFEDTDCFKMISTYPSLLKIPETNLKLTLQQWINAELGTRNFQLLLISHPHLLEVNDEVIRKRIPVLRTFFRGASGLSQLLINSPNIMYEEWNQINAKISYLINERKFKMGDILKSCALSKDLDFIKLRFYVVEKCGVYKQLYLKPHEESRHKKVSNKNPLLKHIVQNSNEIFAKFVAKITLEEYLAAKDLFTDENDSENSVSDDDTGVDEDDD